MDEKKRVVEVDAAEPDPAKVAVELAAAREMQARMMWGIKRGVNAKDTGSLKVLRGMNRKQRRAALAQAGKRQRKTRSSGRSTDARQSSEGANTYDRSRDG
jgi:hypothetical protein